MLFNSENAPIWANQPAGEYRNVSGSAANLQNVHSCGNARGSEQSFRLRFGHCCLPSETPELFCCVAEKVVVGWHRTAR